MQAQEQEIEALLQRLEVTIQEQERDLQAGAAERLTQRLERNRPDLERLAGLLHQAEDLPQELQSRLASLRDRAQELATSGESVLLRLRSDLADAAKQKQGFASYGAAQRWPHQDSAFLNQKR